MNTSYFKISWQVKKKKKSDKWITSFIILTTTPLQHSSHIETPKGKKPVTFILFILTLCKL